MSFDARVVEEAEYLWRLNPTPRELAEANGWGWHYGKPGFEWCGHAAASIYRALGVDPELLRTTFASTARLANKGPSGSRWHDHGYERPEVPLRALRPGDLVCVRTGADKSYGDHIVVCVEAPEDGKFKTVEGNARGHLHSGEWARGVVTRTRKLRDVRQVLRLSEEHVRE
jgi:hypothetical protein